MDIPVETLQCWLENAWDDSPAAANTLRPQLRINERNAANLFSASGSLASVSKNSASQAYRGTALGSLTQVQIQYGWRMLINLYDEVKCWTDNLYHLSQNQNLLPQPLNQQCVILLQLFVTQFPTYAADPDPAIYFFMQKRTQPIYEYESDLTLLLLQPTAYAGGLINPVVW